jgi:hypothetical protein
MNAEVWHLPLRHLAILGWQSLQNFVAEGTCPWMYVYSGHRDYGKYNESMNFEVLVFELYIAMMEV